MQTRNTESTSQSTDIQNDERLRMRMDSNPAPTSDEQFQAEVIPTSPTATMRHYEMMEDKVVDDVCILKLPPPHSRYYVGDQLSARESKGETASNSSVTPSKRPANSTETKANPGGLDFPHGVKRQGIAADNQVDEEITEQTSMESEDENNVFLLSDESAPSVFKERSTVELPEGLNFGSKPCLDGDRGQYEDRTSGNEESSEETDEAETLSTRKENWWEYEEEINRFRVQNPLNTTQDEDKAQFKDICGQDGTSPTIPIDQADIRIPVTNTPTTPDFKGDEGCLEFSDSDEICCSTPGLYPTSTKLEEMTMFGEDSEGNRKIVKDIEQGEQLLQRLLVLEIQHTMRTSETLQTSQQDEEYMRGERIEALDSEDDIEESEDNLQSEETKDEAELIKFETAKSDDNVTHEIETANKKEYVQQKAELVQVRDSDEDDGSSLVPHDFFFIHPLGKSQENSFELSEYRFSADQTTRERQIEEVIERKHNLQRVSGVFNLTENPDVLEIPFKTNISLESLSKGDSNQDCKFQLSEQHMQNELKVQLKEKRLHFEAFQQDNTQNTTKHQKHIASTIKSHGYPSVLDRTRCLEMLSLEHCPVSKSHSSSMNRSPTCEWDRTQTETCISPCTKLHKHPHLSNSLDSISSTGSTNAAVANRKATEKIAVQAPPALTKNPFFKLRPALALQPEVEKDIREARDREEELCRQRCSLYGDKKQYNKDEDNLRFPEKLIPGVSRHQTRKLGCVWPPPPKKDQVKSDQQEIKVQRGQKAALWQRWESGLINGQEKK